MSTPSNVQVTFAGVIIPRRPEVFRNICSNLKIWRTELTAFKICHNDEHKKPQMMGYKNISIQTTSHYTGLLTVDKWLDHQE